MKKPIVLLLVILTILQNIAQIAASPPVIDEPKSFKHVINPPEPIKSNYDSAAVEEYYQKYLESLNEVNNAIPQTEPEPIQESKPVSTPKNDQTAPTPQPVQMAQIPLEPATFSQTAMFDITGHWAENAILYCYDRGFANGAV